MEIRQEGNVWIVDTGHKDSAGNPIERTAVKTFEDGVMAHKARTDLIDYLASGGPVFKPDEINYSLYTQRFPWLLPPGSYSLKSHIIRYKDSNDENEYFQGEFSSSMTRAGLAATLGVSPDSIIRGEGGYFRVNLAGIPESNITAAEAWFKLKQESSLRSPIWGWNGASAIDQQLHDLFTPASLDDSEGLFSFYKLSFKPRLVPPKVEVIIEDKTYHPDEYRFV